LAAVRSAAAAAAGAAAADDDDDCFIRHDARSTAAPVSAYPNSADAAAAAPPHSLMSLKAQRVTSGALPPPPSISLPWTASSHQALPPSSISTGVADGFSRSHSYGLGNSDINTSVAEKSASEAAELSVPPYLAHRYSPRAQEFKEGVEMELDRQAAKQDCSLAKVPIASLLPYQTAAEAQEHAVVPDARQSAAPLSSWSSPPQLASTASAARPPSPSPSPSSTRQSSSIPSLLDSIALSSAGDV
jgi:hypothetical protein